MLTGDWISRACPRCKSDNAAQTVRADATALTCQACGHDWAVRRMPLDAEAADIVRRSRERRAHGQSHTANRSARDGTAVQRDEGSRECHH